MAGYDQLPNVPTIELSKFIVNIPEADLQDLKDQLRTSKLGPKTYENMGADGRFGVTYEWMSQAKAYWETTFDWRAVEDAINGVPNFIAEVASEGAPFRIHFAALFSQKKDAIPLMCVHGWPGSFLEFLGILSALQEKHKPSDLPYHIIIPSLPGYTFSDTPPVNRDWRIEDSAGLLHKLMCGLGFETGYALQGGDIGSYTARIMASLFESCKALHLNFCPIPCPDEAVHGRLPIEDWEKVGLERADDFVKYGTAYSVEHSTRASTIGFVLSSSPLALLAWIGEKFLAWTDKTPSMDQILESVALYWLTETFPRAMYPYRQETVYPPPKPKSEDEYRKVVSEGAQRYMPHNDPKYYCHQPLGYSWFPREIVPIPKSWASTTGNLVWSNKHTEGGHFAAMEQPKELLADMEDFLKQVWP